MLNQEGRNKLDDFDYTYDFAIANKNDDSTVLGTYKLPELYKEAFTLRLKRLGIQIVEKSEKVIAVVSGHVHWNQLHFMDGIPHISLQSISETFTTHPHPAGAWGLLELSDTLNLEVAGRQPIKLTLPLKQMTDHWLPPME